MKSTPAMATNAKLAGRRMNIRRTASRLAPLLLAALLGATLSSAGPLRAQAPSPEKLVISYVPGNAIYWEIDVAIEKGFFKDEAFAPEVVIFQSSPQSLRLHGSPAISSTSLKRPPSTALTKITAATLSPLGFHCAGAA
jgi:hypothetical protein